MKREKLKWLKVVACFGCAIAMLASCDDSNEPVGKGDVEFEITDGPSDDASVKGVFVTVTDLKVDGKSVTGFARQTIDLKAYQEGKTKLLVKAQELDARTYENLTLVLDLNSDASGNAPGCYALTTDDVKYKLKSTGSGMAEITVNKDWRVAANTTNKIVIDFDLRKSIAYSSDPAIRYTFVSDANLGSAVRIVAKDRAGTIKGSYEEDGTLDADKVIVYAYRKGTFNASAETQAQSEDNILFANAVASAEVKSGLTGKGFTLALLEEGEYELHFAAHEEEPSGKLKFHTMLESETSVNGSAGGIITLQAGTTVNITSIVAAEL